MDGAFMPSGHQESLAVDTGLQDCVPLLFETLPNQCPDRLIVVYKQNGLHEINLTATRVTMKEDKSDKPELACAYWS
jgi:hypothetical protein